MTKSTFLTFEKSQNLKIPFLFSLRSVTSQILARSCVLITSFAPLAWTQIKVYTKNAILPLSQSSAKFYVPSSQRNVSHFWSRLRYLHFKTPFYSIITFERTSSAVSLRAFSRSSVCISLILYFIALGGFCRMLPTFSVLSMEYLIWFRYCIFLSRIDSKSWIPLSNNPQKIILWMQRGVSQHVRSIANTVEVEFQPVYDN